MRSLAFPLSSIALALAMLGGAAAPSLPPAALTAASQGAAHAAGVVIADPHGGPPKTVCVRFSEDAITGKQLLDRANQQLPSIDPVYERFGSQGHAVCALCGEGCEAGDCFCQSRYWNYNVAHDGGWARSGRGVDQRVVEHGDVDGWAFGGDGAAPPFLSFEQVCGPSAEPSPQPTPEPSPEPTPEPTTSASSQPPAPPAQEPSAPARAGSPAASSSPTGVPPATSPSAPADTPSAPADTPSAAATTPNPRVASTAAEDDDVAADAPASPSGSGGAVAFVAVLGGLIGLLLWRRRSR